MIDRSGSMDGEKLACLGESTNREKSIRTSCMGLGEDFHEDLLRDISKAAGGRFHYIESPDHAPEVFTEERGGLLTVVAQNVEVELKFDDGVTGLSQLTGYSWKNNADTSRIIIGDFGAGQVKHVLLAAELPPLEDMSDMLLASMEVKYAEIKKDNIQIKSQKSDLVVKASDSAKDKGPADPEVLLHIGIQRAAQARKDAVKKLDEDDLDGAAKTLEDRRDEIRKLAEGASEPDRLNTEADELNRRAKELREERNAIDSRKFMTAEGADLSRSDYGNIKAARSRRRRNKPD